MAGKSGAIAQTGNDARANVDTKLSLISRVIGSSSRRGLRQPSILMSVNEQLIKIQLPDGSVREVPRGTTANDVAMSISPRLAAAVVVARIRPLAAVPADGAGTGEDSSEAAMYGGTENGERLVDLAAPLNE